MNGDNSPNFARPEKNWFGQFLRAIGIGDKEDNAARADDQNEELLQNQESQSQAQKVQSPQQVQRKPGPATEKDRLRQIRDKYEHGRITQTDLHALASQQQAHASETVVHWTHRDEDRQHDHRMDTANFVDSTYRHGFSVNPEEGMPLPEQASDLVQAWAQRISTPPVPGSERAQTPGIPPAATPNVAGPSSAAGAAGAAGTTGTAGARSSTSTGAHSTYPWSGPAVPSARPESIPVMNRPRARGIQDHSYRRDEAAYSKDETEFQEPLCKHTNGAEISSTSLPKLNGEGRPATRFVLNKRRLGSITLTLAACEPPATHEAEAEKHSTAALDPRTELADEWKCEVDSLLIHETTEDHLGPRPAPPPAMRPIPGAMPSGHAVPDAVPPPPASAAPAVPAQASPPPASAVPAVPAQASPPPASAVPAVPVPPAPAPAPATSAPVLAVPLAAPVPVPPAAPAPLPPAAPAPLPPASPAPPPPASPAPLPPAAPPPVPPASPAPLPPASPAPLPPASPAPLPPASPAPLPPASPAPLPPASPAQSTTLLPETVSISRTADAISKTAPKVLPGRPPAPYSMSSQKVQPDAIAPARLAPSVPPNYTVEEPPVEFTKPLTQFKCYIPVDQNRPGGADIVGPNGRSAPQQNRTDTTDIPSRSNPFAHFSEASLRLLAESPATAPGTLIWLACHHNPDIRASVARNSKTPIETIWLLAQDDEAGVRLSIAENSQSSPSVLQVLSEDKNQLVAWRANNTLKLLQLGQREMEQFKVDQTVAELSSTEYDRYEEPAQSSDESAPYELQPGDIVDLDPPPPETPAPAPTPDTTDETLLAFLTLIAHKASTPQRRLYELARHANPEIRAAVAANDNASLEIMWLLSRDRDKEVREKLLENCNCPIEILEALQDDNDQFIAWSARAILTRLLGGQPITDDPPNRETPRLKQISNP